MLARTLLRELDRLYLDLQEGRVLPVLRRWREMADTLGRPVRVQTATGVLEGVADDVAEDGALLLRLADGTLRRVVAGDVRLREVG